MRVSSHALLALVFIAAPAFANVIVTSPENGETVSSPAKFEATATTTCKSGIGSMGVYIDNKLEYVVNGTTLNTTLALTPGKHNAVLQEWDHCGGATKTAVPITVAGGADATGVWVTTPANNASTAPLVAFVATATTSCANGVSAMGVYVNNQRLYVVNGAKLNTQLTLPAGADYAVVEEWDGCGGAATTPLNLTVTAATTTGGGGTTASPTAKVFTDLQSDPWRSWAKQPPLDNDCGYPCAGVDWNMVTGVKSPSMSGNATQYNISGTTPYSDVLWYDQLIGTASTHGLPDTNHTLLPTLTNFTYDTYFYVTNAGVTQALEFDMNIFANTVGMTFGTECRIAGGNEWDVWNNVEAHWVPTGVACNPINGGWNHLTTQFQKNANNTLTFVSITLNGKTAVLNQTYAPFVVPADWYGIVADFQLDGNQAMSSNTVYLDNFTFTYW